MELKGRVYYCDALKQAGIEVNLGDYRALSDEELFEGLSGLDVSLNVESFESLADTYSDPEEVVEALVPKEPDLMKRALVYLLVFEMWRRFAKEQKNLSIFCDELDYTIALFYEEQLGNEEYLQGLLSKLEGVLEGTVDAKADPKQAFRAINLFFTLPLEVFLYDYIIYQLDEGSSTYASELIDGFYPYLDDPRWFDLLRVKMAGDLDILYGHFLESLMDDPEFELCIETIHYLIAMGEPQEVAKVVEVAFLQMETEEDVQELFEILNHYLPSLSKGDAAIVLKALPKQFQELFT